MLSTATMAFLTLVTLGDATQVEQNLICITLSKIAKTSKATVAVTGSFARKIANEHEPLADNKLSPLFYQK
jgi:hypothetical protein